MKCEDSTSISDLQAGEGQIAQYICQSWIFLQCTCRSAGLCWHSHTPYFSEMPDLVIYCTCSTLLPGICKIALSCPAASFSHHVADVPGYSGKGRSPKLLRKVLVICTVVHICRLFHIRKHVNVPGRKKNIKTKEMHKKSLWQFRVAKLWKILSKDT